MRSRASEGNLNGYYEFIEGSLPDNYKIRYDPSLYNSEIHRRVQSPRGWHSYHIVRNDKKLVIATIHFCVKDRIAYSPISAPFGSLELSPDINASLIYDFISFYEEKLRAHHVKQVIIKNYPEGYHERLHNLITVILFNHSYSIAHAELGALLKVDEDSLMKRMDKWEKRKFQQAQKAKLKFKIIPINQREEVYNFIAKCREERSQSLSMTFDALNLTVKKLTNSFVCFGVFSKDKMVAASISIKQDGRSLYNFYSAHSRDSDKLSPVVYLIHEMYTWCQHHKINLIDLGTSALGGTPNFPLIDFKLRLGAIPSMKLTFEKKFI